MSTATLLNINSSARRFGASLVQLMIVGSLIATGCGSRAPSSSGDSAPSTARGPIADVQPPPLAVVAAGATLACARTSSGGVACWGNGDDRPTAIPGVSDVAQIAVSNSHGCAVTTVGVQCWGTMGNVSIEPKPLNLPPVRAVSAGGDFACALLLAGTVKCWGSNQHGELGIVQSEGSTTPVAVPGLDEIVQISSGETHSCALDRRGAVKCWGVGPAAGGPNHADPTPGPIAMSGMDDAVEIDAGRFHTCALRRNASLACWGSNSNGELGNGSREPVDGPVSVKGIDDAVHIVAGSFSCATRGDGSLWCWGANSSGELRSATKSDDATKPVQLTDVKVRQLAIGNGFACAEVVDATALQCWGYNADRQTGSDDRRSRTGQIALP